ncbi:DNA adenine methylase [Xanthomonas citri]|uniref:DNA adenine methylase n=2 Tax=Xanthomonas citri TaxID=346 RepID=UPI003F812891
MPNVTPLRYPGGKAKLYRYFQRLIAQNNLYDCTYVEPFCGGAGLAIELLRAGIVSAIHLNDLDRAVFAFWREAVDYTDRLCARIEDTPCSMETWQDCKEIYRSSDVSSLEDLGFATFFLNRTNRSGILKGGGIGGKAQSGKWLLDARMNKDDLIERIRKIGKLNSRISVTNLDARDLVSSYGSNSPDNVLMYLDPPYVDKGPGLYLNAYEERDHRRLAALVAELSCHWVVSYDTHDLIREIYRPFQSTDLALHYSAQEHSRVGSELVFFSDNLPPPPDMDGVTSRYRRPWAVEEFASHVA